MAKKDHGRREAEQQARAKELQYQQQLTQANTPTPLQTAFEKDKLDFLDWESGKSGPPDVTKAPGMGAYMDLYNRAKAGQADERMGQGAITMGLNASDPGLSAKLSEQSKARREQDAAGGLENALKYRTAEVHGSVMPLLGMNQQKNLSLAGLTAQRGDNAWDNYFRIRAMPTWLEQMRQQAQQSAQMAAMGA